MTKNSYYVTSPIYYVNDSPHIGHAYTSLACDVVARYMRLEGREVKFLTGTDEHGQKVAKSAHKNNMQPQEFTDEVSKRFVELNQFMNYSNDDFIRTTEDRHVRGAKDIWHKLKQSGNIYLGKYKGWYAVRDEAFYNESDLDENGLAPSGAQVEWVEEPSYFFKLSEWQDKLLELYENNPDFVQPESRRNEVISFVKGGLQDLSISRTSFDWGIKVPDDEEHVMYVWLDALTNYITALGYPDTEAEDFKTFWPADVHIVGKDILRFHAVYWPAFLMAAGIEPPKKILAHGWWTNENQKISKSTGNIIDPHKLVNEFGLDPVRYFLMREITFGSDGNFSRPSFVSRVNSELANNIGNLVQRSLSFSGKYFDGKAPEVPEGYIESQYNSHHLFLKAESIKQVMTSDMEKQKFNIVLDNVVGLSTLANIYIDSKAPWNLRKEDIEETKKVIYNLLEIIRHIAIMLLPFIPETANKILDYLSIPHAERDLRHLSPEYAVKSGGEIQKPEPIIPKFSEEDDDEEE
jgi:methionyl-tRNA synthetase